MTASPTAPAVETRLWAGNHPVAGTRPAAGDCHLWLVPIGDRPDWLEVLDAEERRAVRRLTVAEVRMTFLTSRAAQRIIGSRYLGTTAEQVRINRVCHHCGAGHGRPVIDGATFDYSVSHAGGWVVIALVGPGFVGVDIEKIDARRDVDGLGRVALTAGEAARAAALSPALRRSAFFTSWTRKEAAMKLTGLGLQAPPHQIDVSGPRAMANQVPGWPDVPVLLQDVPAPAGYKLAIASTTPVAAVRRHVLADHVRPPAPDSAAHSPRSGSTASDQAGCLVR